LKERHTQAINDWLMAHLQADEEVMVIDGIPAVDTADSVPHWIWLVPWIAALVGVALIHDATARTLALVVLAVVIVLMPMGRARQCYVAVTDRRLLLQELSFWKARPQGPVVEHSLRSVGVRSFEPATRWTRYFSLVLDIRAAQGLQKIRLRFRKISWLPSHAPAIREAITRGSPPPSAG
jgi:hypothetical protein